MKKCISKCMAFICCTYLLCACIGGAHKTTDPNLSYKYWAGEEADPDSVQVLNGQYWSSAHFTAEYIVYLKLKSLHHWGDRIKKKLLPVDSLSNDSIRKELSTFTLPTDAPEWFDIKENFVRYVISTRGSGADNLYFWDEENDIWYIYEVCL